MQVPHGAVNVHGHVHEQESPTPNRDVNVSVEQLNYRPPRPERDPAAGPSAGGRKDHPGTQHPGAAERRRTRDAVSKQLVALGRETGDRTLDRERVTARDVSRWLGADTGDAQGLDRLRRRLDAPAIPSAVRAKGRQVFDRPVSDRLGVDRSGLHPRFYDTLCKCLILRALLFCH